MIIASLSSTIDETQQSILSFLDGFTSSMGANGSLISATAMLALTPFAVWICIFGIKFMLGMFKDSSSIRNELTRIFILLLVLVGGSTVFTVVNTISKEFSSVIESAGSAANLTMSVGMKGGKFKISSFYTDDQQKDIKSNNNSTTVKENALGTWGMLNFKIANSVGGLFSDETRNERLNRWVNTDARALKNVDKLQKQFNIIKSMEAHNNGEVGLMSPEEIVTEYLIDIEDSSFWYMNLSQIIAYTLLCIGKLFRLIMLCFQKVMITMMQLAFPFAVGLSFLPTMERTFETWLQNYISITLLGVTISIITTFQTFASISVVGDMLYSIILLFLAGILCLLSPAINVMLFGGSGAISGLPGQIVQTGAATGGMASSIYKKIVPSSLFKK